MTKDIETTEAPKAPVDLATLEPAKIMAQSIRVEIKHPATKAGTGQYIWIFGNDHPKVKAYVDDKVDADLARTAERRQRGKLVEAPTVQKGVNRTVELLCVATDRWENVLFKGVPNADFTVANARELYAFDWLRDQLLEAMGDYERFL